jgi:LacI family transcriptional regulator
MPKGVAGGASMSAVTSRDVALAAGVAQSTVSRALNEHPSVRPDTRARVREAADRLGYIPNAAARSLIKSRSNLVGLLVSNVMDAYVPEFIDAVTGAAFERGYTIIIGSVQERPDLQLAYLRMLAEHQVAGAILTSGLLGSADAIRPFIQRGLPMVFANREIDGIASDAVVFDNTSATRLATGHLISHQRKCLAFVGGRPDAATTRDRVAGFHRALDESPAASAGVHLGSYSRDFGYETTRALVHAGSMVDGVVAADDTVAIGCLDAIADAGLAVGADVAVIGFGDQPAASMRSVSLSTVGASARALGRASFELLVDRLEGRIDGPRRRVELGHELVLRASCGAHDDEVAKA